MYVGGFAVHLFASMCDPYEDEGETQVEGV